jgi:hypothetical protein
MSKNRRSRGMMLNKTRLLEWPKPGPWDPG